MPERKPWSNEEDALLKQLREEEKISKWSLIAKKMSEQYHLPGRTGKQCRERYHNHLDVMISRSQWSPEEQQYLYRLHDEIGNKWAIIAQKLPGRTDNCVKNHFYSKMRKAIRKLNKVIHMHFKKEIKEIRLNVLYKLVEATDEKFKLNPVIDEQISDRCCELKNQLLEYANEEDQEEQIHDIDKLQQLARNIHEVSSRYRKRPKRSRRNSAHGPEIIPLGKFSPKYRSANSDNEFSSDEEDDSNENPDSFSIKGGLGLASVKQEEQLKDGTFTVPSFIEQDNYEMKFEEGPIEFDENLYRENQNNNEEQSFNPNYMMEIQNNLSTPRIENLLGEQIQRLDLNGAYYLNDLDLEDCDDRLI